MQSTFALGRCVVLSGNNAGFRKQTSDSPAALEYRTSELSEKATSTSWPCVERISSKARPVERSFCRHSDILSAVPL